jgi:hypothetical protein
MERMLTSLPSHFRPRPQASVSPLQPHELVFAIRVRNMDLLQREVLLRATPPARPAPGQGEGQGDGDGEGEDEDGGVYQRWFSYDEVTAITAAQDSAQAVLDWLAGLTEETGTGAAVVTHVSPRHDFIRVTAPVGLWATHLRTAFTAYEHITAAPPPPSSSVHEKKKGGSAASGGGSTEGAPSEPASPPPSPSSFLVLRADSYSLPVAVAQHVETVFNTVQVPLRTRRARRNRHLALADAAEPLAPNMDADGDGYGEILEDLPGLHIDAAVAPGVTAQLRPGGGGGGGGGKSDQPDEQGREEGLDSLFTDRAGPHPSIRPTRSLRPNRSPVVAPSKLTSSRLTARPSRRPSPRPSPQVRTADSAPLDVTIPFLRNLYQIPRPPSSNPHTITGARVRSADVSRQSVFETNQESFSNQDLATFLRTNSLPQQKAVAVGGGETDTCSLSGSTGASCFEGNLDVQFITGIAAGSGATTEVWHVDADTGDPFLNWILAASQDPSPPAVTSISWGNDERYTSPSVMAAFEREAIKLGAIGVTILVSSGDNGVAGYDCKKGACDESSSSDSSYWTKSSSWTGTGFFPKFPAGCPWVTAVGATAGPER